jgi:hypothetical protein
MSYSPKSDSGTTACPTYGSSTPNTITRTIAYNVTCVLTNSGTQYYSDVSTITGTGECGYVDCYPTFTTHLFNSNSLTMSNSFNQTSTNYYSLLGCHSNGGSTDTRYCQNKACTTTGGGGCTICPVIKPNLCCTCPCGSPIILDVDGKGFNLTNAQNGVNFDITGDGKQWQMAWTAGGSTNAFLTLPGADGLIHTGKQLFGNFTPQPTSATPNGFLALAVYDDPKNGGNGDGVIDSRDAVFASLRLWIDANHDGISQPEELHSLPSLGVNSISLKYKQSDRTDQFGNVFRYRAAINSDDPASPVARTAYDVFFGILPSPAAKNGVQSCPAPKAGVTPATTK